MVCMPLVRVRGLTVMVRTMKIYFSINSNGQFGQ